MRQTISTIFLLILTDGCFGQTESWTQFCSDYQNTANSTNKNPLPVPKLKWKFRTAEKVWSSPVVSNGVVFFGSVDSCFYAIDCNSGKEIWKVKTKHWIGSSPTIQDSTIYFGGFDRYFYALDTKTGKTKWKFKTDSWIMSSPKIIDNTIVFGSNDGNVYALK